MILCITYTWVKTKYILRYRETKTYEKYLSFEKKHVPPDIPGFMGLLNNAPNHATAANRIRTNHHSRKKTKKSILIFEFNFI